MKRIRLKYLVAGIPVLLTSVLANFILPSNASAATTIEDQEYKYVAEAIYNCYTKGKVKDNVRAVDVKSLTDLVDDSTPMVGLPPSMFDKDEYTCAGLMEVLPNPVSSDVFASTDQAVALLNKLGYSYNKEATTNGTRKCETFSFEYTDDSQIRNKNAVNPTICADVSSSGVVSRLGAKESKSTTGDDAVFALTPYVDGKVILAINGNRIEIDGNYLEVGVKSGETKWDDLIKSLNNMLSAYAYGKQRIYSPTVPQISYHYQGHSLASSETNDSETVYKLDLSYSDKSSYKNAYKNLTNREYPNLNISSEERLALYQHYLVSYYGMAVTGCADKESDVPKDTVVEGDASDPSAWHLTRLFTGEDGKAQYCYAKATAHFNDEIYGVEGGPSKNLASMPNAPGRIGFLSILDIMKDSKLSKISADLVSQIGQASEQAAQTEDETSCYDKAGALGWILCSALEALEGAVQGLYDKVIAPFLTIRTENFDESRGLYKSWQIFQTFANIAFAIMILVVIFSQLTGIGIDNYGIKRILPRLIIAALLINLSFIICQVAVDVSNILGFSFKGLFDNLAKNIDFSSVTSKGSGAVTDGAVVVTTVIAAFVGGAAIFSQGLIVIIPLLLGVLGVFISIFFLFLILGVRQAGVVVLTVIAPLALVCYMLPNTKKYFDSWVKIFVSLLIVYPLCGLLIGGGNFAGAVLLSVNSEDFFFQLAAMLVSVVPYFFVPTLLRRSLAALGNVGATINGIGGRIRGGATRRANDRIRNSDRVKDYQERTLQRRRAGVNRNGEVTKFGQFRRRIASGDSRLSRFTTQSGRERMMRSMGEAQSSVLKSQAALSGAERMLDDSHVKAAYAGMEAADMAQAVKDQEALIGSMKDENGNLVVDNMGKGGQALTTGIGKEYRQALAALNADPNNAEAKSRVFAFQNKLATTDGGRNIIQTAMQDAYSKGETAGISSAASHLVNEHAGDIKNVNRGLFNWANAAAGGDLTSSPDSHGGDGAMKYTAQTLGAADDGAIQRLVQSYNSNMSEAEKSAISQTAYEAINNENIQLKPEVREQLEKMAKDYTPPVTTQQTEAQAQTQALNDINDTLREIHANQSSPTPPPQPKPEGPSTEDWDDYINGNL